MPEARVTCQVSAVHVACSLCGDRQRIPVDGEDTFTEQVLMPLGSWWIAHRAPRIRMFEAQVGDDLQEWHAV